MNMRNIIKYSVFVLLAGIVFACRPHQYPHILVEADSLCEAKPDSAVSLLRSLKPQFATAGKADRMYYQLLCIKAADKAFIPHESDSTILSVVDYYKSKGDKEKLAEAYFYAGSVYRDLNDAPEQLKYLQLSLDVMPDDYPILKRMLTHYQIGRLFILQDLDEEAIPSFREAIRLCRLTADTVRMIHFLRDAAFAWEGIEELDSAMIYYQKAYDLSEEINNESLKSGIKYQLAAVYDTMGKKQQALEMLRSINVMDEKDNISSNYSIASRIYEHNGMLDSALLCYRKLLSDGNLMGRCLANEKLAAYSLQSRDYRNAYQHLLTFNAQSDSVNKQSAAEAIERMHSLYNYNIREKEVQRLALDNKNKAILLVISLFVIVLAVAIAIIMWIHSKRRQAELEQGMQKLEILREKELQLSDKAIAENKVKIEQLRNSISRLGNENISLKQQLENQLRMTLTVVKNAEDQRYFKQQSEVLLQESDIRKVINNRLQEKTPLKQNDWEIIETELNSLFTDFSSRVSALLKMSEQEFHICLLIKADVKTNDIAVLTSRTKQAISNAKSRMYQKAFKVKGTADEWDKVIESL